MEMQNMWINIKFVFYYFLRELLKAKIITLYYGVHDAYLSKIYDNNSTKSEMGGEKKNTVVKFLYAK